MKKKHLLLTVALCLSVAAFTGCGNMDTDTNMDGQVTDNPDAASSPNATDNSLMDDMENGVDDVINGAEDAVDDAVDGTENALDDATDNNTQDKKDNNNSVTSGRDKKSNTNR